jgi:ribonuclease P protein component
VLDKYLFKRSSRLRKAHEFKAVKDAGIRIRDRYLIINAKKNHLNYPRIGIIASKKSIPKAVRRNQVRRLIKEWFRMRQKTLPSMDIVVIIAQASRDQQSQVLRECLEKLVQKLTNHCKSL